MPAYTWNTGAGLPGAKFTQRAARLFADGEEIDVSKRRIFSVNTDTGEYLEWTGKIKKNKDGVDILDVRKGRWSRVKLIWITGKEEI
jgi:hypothetical protein